MPDYFFGPHGFTDCTDYEYMCSSEQCDNDPLNNAGNGFPNCACPPFFIRDCTCACKRISPTPDFGFNFQTDCGCTNGLAFETYGACPTPCPTTDEMYCPFPYGSELDCSEIPDEDEDGDPIDGADVPKPSINKKWTFEVTENSFNSPVTLPFTLNPIITEGIYDVSNIFYADLIVNNNLNMDDYSLYGIINNQIRGFALLNNINSINYYYLETKWQQTQEQNMQIFLYVKSNTSGNIYQVDNIMNPDNISIGNVNTLITSLSWYS